MIVKIDNIGDFIIFSSFIYGYATLYGDYKISIVVNSVCFDLAQKFCRSIKQIDKIISFDGQRFEKDFFYKINILRSISGEMAEIAIQPTFSRNQTGDFLIKSSGAKQKIGYDGDLNNIGYEQKNIDNKFYTKLVTGDKKLESEIDINKHFLQQLGGKIENPLPTLPVTNEEKNNATRVLLKNKLPEDMRFVLIQLGAGAAYRQWPIERFMEIIKYLTEEKKFFCVLVGSSNEKGLSSELLKKNRNNSPMIVDLIGQTNLIDLIAIASMAYFYFGNETGTLHIAAAVGIPTVCILGGGHFGRFFPYGNPQRNRVVYDKNMRCMKDNWQCSRTIPKGQPSPCIAGITTEQVKSEINNLLAYMNKNT